MTTPPGRNDPCPCGSGKKYKKCHLPAEQAKVVSPGRLERWHQVDRDLLIALADFAHREYGEEWEDILDSVEFIPPSLRFHWIFHHARIGGRPIVDAFLARHLEDLSPDERLWVDASRAAWLSVREVTAVDPGKSVTLKDLLSGETHAVAERTASRELQVRDVILCRVVEIHDLCLLCGIHETPLPPRRAEEVLQRVRGKLRLRRTVPVDRLRDDALGDRMIEWWEDVIEEWEGEPDTPPTLVNGDGDPIRPTEDRFTFDPANRGQVRDRLAALDGVELLSTAEGDEIVFGKPAPKGRKTVVAFGALGPDHLVLETNSMERADAVRARVDTTLGPLARHAERTHPDASVPPRITSRSDGPDLSPAEVRRIEEELLAEHYATWPDEPVPALDGKTPREMMRTASGRRRVDLLLREMEHLESHRDPDMPGYDVSRIREELGLED